VAANNLYAESFERVINRLVAVDPKLVEENIYFTPAPVNNPLHIIVTSNSGLCGAYNEELLHYVAKNLPKDEPIFAIGGYGIKRLMHDDYLVIKEFDKLENVETSMMGELIYDILALYSQGEISSLDIYYTHYINTLTFSPDRYDLLPLKPKPYHPEKEILFEPDFKTVMAEVVPQYVSSLVYNTLLESKISEHAARRAAMESANRNAEDLTNELMISRNRARQEAITQQVTEITAGAQSGRKE
jgi:F-type H+-transporting ATPase subunit gamma